MKISRYSILALLPVVILVLCLSGCADLGAFEDKDTYYSFFGDITFYSDTSKTSYSMKDLYSDETVEHINKACMNQEAYRYISLEVKKDVKIDTLSLFLGGALKEGSPTSVPVRVNVYRVKSGFSPSLDGSSDDISGIYRKQSTTDTIIFNGVDGKVTYKDKEADYKLTGNKATFSIEVEKTNKTKETVNYECTLSSDLMSLYVKSSNMATPDLYTWEDEAPSAISSRMGSSRAKVGQADMTLKFGEDWEAFSVETWYDYSTDKEEETLTFAKGDYIVIEIMNNCKIGKRKKLDSVEFQANNYMIRAI